jgi:hypothetical protein
MIKALAVCMRQALSLLVWSVSYRVWRLVSYTAWDGVGYWYLMGVGCRTGVGFPYFTSGLAAGILHMSAAGILHGVDY